MRRRERGEEREQQSDAPADDLRVRVRVPEQAAADDAAGGQEQQDDENSRHMRAHGAHLQSHCSTWRAEA